MKIRNFSILAVVVLILLIGGWVYYRYSEGHPNTKDAYLGMHIVQMAPQVSGQVKQVFVHDNQPVQAGQVLFTIDPASFELAVNQAEARLSQARDSLSASDAQVSAAEAHVKAAEATYREAERHAERLRNPVKTGAASKDQGDAAQRAKQVALDNLKAAQAELATVKAQRGASANDNATVKAAQAALGQAQLDLQHTQIVAPADGVVGNLDIRPGGFVVAGRPLFALVETRDVWVDANFKETDLERIHPGQEATVTVDMLPGKTFKGKVESLSPASGTAFSLLPPENATGNWVKVTQRFPVRVHITDPVLGMRVGASSEVTINATNDGGS